MGKCLHPQTKRGLDVPRRWGSFRSEVCCACGAWRPWTHTGALYDARWRSAIDYQESIQSDDDKT